jgi:hypothetical protein
MPRGSAARLLTIVEQGDDIGKRTVDTGQAGPVMGGM